MSFQYRVRRKVTGDKPMDDPPTQFQFTTNLLLNYPSSCRFSHVLSWQMKKHTKVVRIGSNCLPQPHFSYIILLNLFIQTLFQFKCFLHFSLLFWFWNWSSHNGKDMEIRHCLSVYLPLHVKCLVRALATVCVRITVGYLATYAWASQMRGGSMAVFVEKRMKWCGIYITQLNSKMFDFASVYFRPCWQQTVVQTIGCGINPSFQLPLLKIGWWWSPCHLPPIARRSCIVENYWSVNDLQCMRPFMYQTAYLQQYFKL